MKKIIVAAVFFFGFTFALTAQTTFLLKNKLTGTYLNVEDGLLLASASDGSSQSAQWEFSDAGTEQFRIRNLGEGTSLNIEYGFACTPIQQNWWSAIWKIQIVEGSNEVMINNLWYPTHYINMNNGLDCSEITENPNGAIWELEEVVPSEVVEEDAEVIENEGEVVINDVKVDEDAGPSQQLTIAAQNPVLIPVYNQDVLAFAYNIKDEKGSRVMISCYQKQGEQFSRSWSKILPHTLDKLGGFATDGTNYYCLTVKDENISNDPSVNNYRNNVVRLVKLDEKGNEIWAKEINNKAYLSVPVYSPMIAGTGGLAYGNGMVTLVFAKNTEWDSNISTRHQTAVFLTVNAATGEPTKTGEEVSWRHSFDQRIIFDGQDFVFADLCDPGFMPAAGIALRKVSIADGEVQMPDPMYYWSHGAYVYARQGDGNSLFTSLGNIVSGNKGYTVLFSSERSNSLSGSIEQFWLKPVLEPRNLGLVHVVKEFETVKDGLDGGQPQVTNLHRLDNNKMHINITSKMVDTKTGNANALNSYSFKSPTDLNMSATQSGLVWLTNYSGKTNFTSVERPKLVRLENDQCLALWEEWIFDQVENPTPVFSATKCMLVDAYGNVLKPASQVSARLNPNGSDLPFMVDGKAAWITSGKGMKAFNLHTVDGNLQTKHYSLSE